jgi:hypothetical protein
MEQNDEYISSVLEYDGLNATSVMSRFLDESEGPKQSIRLWKEIVGSCILYQTHDTVGRQDPVRLEKLKNNVLS